MTIPSNVRVDLAKVLKPLIAARAKERQGARTDLSNIPQAAGGMLETREEIAKIAGVSHETVAARAKERQSEGGKEKVVQAAGTTLKTREEIAKIAGVSRDTVQKDLQQFARCRPFRRILPKGMICRTPGTTEASGSSKTGDLSGDRGRDRGMGNDAESYATGLRFRLYFRIGRGGSEEPGPSGMDLEVFEMAEGKEGR